MNIELKYCNNIDSAQLTITESKLNIKFAPNGTGKSTIAKAIINATKDESKLSELIPFKYRESNPENCLPTVNGISEITDILCFDEDYVNQYVFKQDELVDNSFDIFIRTDSYNKLEQEIELLISDVKSLFINNEELETLINNLKSLGSAFKITKTGLSKSSTGMKGLSQGNKLHYIPDGLEAYKPFIQDACCVDWIDWQTKGNAFLELADSCPFCSSDTTTKKEIINKVTQEYDKNTIKNLISIINIIDTLGDYFSDDARLKLTEITKLKDGLEKEHENYLKEIKGQIDILVENLERLKTLSGFHFKDGEQVSEKLPSYKLNLTFFDRLNSQRTQDAISTINDSIDQLTEKASLLQGKINMQRSQMVRVVESHQLNINNFLEFAGYKYKVEIVGEEGNAKLKLLHLDHHAHLSGGNQHLSFGERNAFAIVLFMYECLAKKPSLIILDDPISSFDKNKKYAILEMLFRRDGDKCLKGKTVLMLTHDVEPIIDTIKSLHDKFQNQTTASFLKLTSGNIVEHVITRNDIHTFAQICKNILTTTKDAIIKLIYLRRRYEIIDDKGHAYQVLSNLFHKRDKSQALDSRNNPTSLMACNDFDDGCIDIQSEISTFDYEASIALLKDNNRLLGLYNNSQNGYEKLQLFRLLVQNDVNPVVQKFINETYHIENEFVCQLNPETFDVVPEYVILECDKILSTIGN